MGLMETDRQRFNEPKFIRFSDYAALMLAVIHKTPDDVFLHHIMIEIGRQLLGEEFDDYRAYLGEMAERIIDRRGEP